MRGGSSVTWKIIRDLLTLIHQLLKKIGTLLCTYFLPKSQDIIFSIFKTFLLLSYLYLCISTNHIKRIQWSKRNHNADIAYFFLHHRWYIGIIQLDHNDFYNPKIPTGYLRVRSMFFWRDSHVIMLPWSNAFNVLSMICKSNFLDCRFWTCDNSIMK